MHSFTSAAQPSWGLHETMNDCVAHGLEMGAQTQAVFDRTTKQLAVHLTITEPENSVLWTRPVGNEIDSLVPMRWRYGNDFQTAIPEHMSHVHSWEIPVRWIPEDFNDDKPTLVRVMVWCRQTTSHYLSHVDQDLAYVAICRHYATMNIHADYDDMNKSNTLKQVSNKRLYQHFNNMHQICHSNFS